VEEDCSQKFKGLGLITGGRVAAMVRFGIREQAGIVGMAAIVLFGGIGIGANRAIAESTISPGSFPAPLPQIDQTQISPQLPQIEQNQTVSPTDQKQAAPQTNQKPTAQGQQDQAKPAKAPLPDKFPPNPLEITEPDPLIPYDYKDRPLTAQERKEITAAADRLALRGAAQLQQGDAVGAFASWNRELRLRRLVGPLTAEVRALGRVGDVAWRTNDLTELRYITLRLDDIWKLNKPSTNDSKPEQQQTQTGVSGLVPDRAQLWQELGLAYQLVRLPKSATQVYEELLAEARRRDNTYLLEATLISLGQVQMGWFDYAGATKTYQELLERSQARNDLFNEPIYLNQLAYIAEQAKQPEQAINYQEQLVSFYQRTSDPKPIPALKLKIADNYHRLKQLDQAEANYQLAYQLAQPQLQFAVAGDALRKLGDLYRENNRLEAALRMYSFLVLVEQQAYNTYGVMTAYDQLGQLYTQQKQYPQAIAAFQKGLEIARQLKNREDYFVSQIEKLGKGVGSGE
jgi:tetratricopeptide (TPR) repeat protein